MRPLWGAEGQEARLRGHCLPWGHRAAWPDSANAIGYTGPHSTPRRAPGAGQQGHLHRRGLVPRGPNLAPQGASPDCPAPVQRPWAWQTLETAPSASGTGGGAGMGRPVLGHTEGEPGGEHWACPSTQTQTLGSVSAGHQVGDKRGGVMGSSGPRKPGEVAACPAWRPARLLTRPGHPQDAPAPWAARGHAAAATRSLSPARSRAALGRVSGRPHALCVHSDLAPTPLHDQPSVPPCRPSKERW